MNRSTCIQLFCIFWLFTACGKDKIINDSKKSCATDCTTVGGRVVTVSNKPVEGVKITFSHITVSGPGCIFCPTTTRFIGKTTTDQNGGYLMDFFLKDEEIGVGSGYFKLIVDESSIDAGRYIKNTAVEFEKTYYSIALRDTIFLENIYIPERATVKVHLRGFKKLHESDKFEVQSLFPFGFELPTPNNFLGGMFGTGISPYGTYVASSENYTANVVVARGDSSVLRVSRIKNGQGNLLEEKRILATGSNNIELTFDW